MPLSRPGSAEYRLPRFFLALVALVLLFFAPQLWLTAQSSGRIYGQVESIPAHEYALVLGARVYDDGSLSDAARERVEAGVRLYRAGAVRKLYISGDNRNNQEAEVIARYAESQGVPAGDIVVDKLGIDTHDSCRHLAATASAGIVVSQAFHLPRAMFMCETDGLQVVGLAANRLGLLASRGDSVLEIYATRVGRFVREAYLTWTFVLGIYDRVSNEVE